MLPSSFLLVFCLLLTETLNAASTNSVKSNKSSNQHNPFLKKLKLVPFGEKPVYELRSGQRSAFASTKSLTSSKGAFLQDPDGINDLINSLKTENNKIKSLLIHFKDLSDEHLASLGNAIKHVNCKVEDIQILSKTDSQKDMIDEILLALEQRKHLHNTTPTLFDEPDLKIASNRNREKQTHLIPNLSTSTLKAKFQKPLQIAVFTSLVLTSIVVYVSSLIILWKDFEVTRRFLKSDSSNRLFNLIRTLGVSSMTPF